MKLTLVLLLCVGAFALQTPPLKDLAVSCVPTDCVLPDCVCSSTNTPNNLPVHELPQIVMVTFDDAVQALNYEFFEQSILGRTNPDDCPVGATFFIPHEYTDYSKVHSLWAAGNEIALHSITKTPDVSYWRNATVDLFNREFGDYRSTVSHFANIPIEQIKGMRVPFLQLAKDNSFLSLVESELTYDFTWPSQSIISPGLWPYSLKYASSQDCPIGNCPTASIPNAWVLPMLNWEDQRGIKCTHINACVNIPTDTLEILEWMKKNFNDSYLSNKAPFGVFLHSAWFQTSKNNFDAFNLFLDYLGNLNDVYVVPASRALEYVRRPIPRSEGNPWVSCQTFQSESCKPKTCQLKKSPTEERWMTSCAATCPNSYPWLDNALGENILAFD